MAGSVFRTPGFGYPGNTNTRFFGHTLRLSLFFTYYWRIQHVHACLESLQGELDQDLIVYSTSQEEDLMGGKPFSILELVPDFEVPCLGRLSLTSQAMYIIRNWENLQRDRIGLSGLLPQHVLDMLKKRTVRREWSIYHGTPWDC